MASAKAAQEPSMEEILASIRQIIADEDAPESEAEDVKDQAAVDDAFDNIEADGDGEEMSTDDVDALFDAPAAGVEEEAEEENDQAAIDAAFESMGGDDAEAPADDVDAILGSEDVGDQGESTSGAADEDSDDDVLALSADQTLGEDDISFDMADSEEPEPVSEPAEAPSANVESDSALLSNDTAGAVKSSLGALNSAMTVSSENSVEDLVKSMLRPMLKQWLDENLPETVERLVQAEIERMRNQ